MPGNTHTVLDTTPAKKRRSSFATAWEAGGSAPMMNFSACRSQRLAPSGPVHSFVQALIQSCPGLEATVRSRGRFDDARIRPSILLVSSPFLSPA